MCFWSLLLYEFSWVIASMTSNQYQSNVFSISERNWLVLGVGFVSKSQINGLVERLNSNGAFKGIHLFVAILSIPSLFHWIVVPVYHQRYVLEHFFVAILSIPSLFHWIVVPVYHQRYVLEHFFQTLLLCFTHIYWFNFWCHQKSTFSMKFSFWSDKEFTFDNSQKIRIDWIINENVPTIEKQRKKQSFLIFSVGVFISPSYNGPILRLNETHNEIHNKTHNHWLTSLRMLFLFRRGYITCVWSKWP